MHQKELHHWQHSHTFDQDKKRPGEVRTLIVIAITGVMMVVEIFAGKVFGSMALLADGLHMGSHTAALGVGVFAYVYARKHAADRRFCFGTGKINALGGFTSGVLLLVFAIIMAWQSVERLINPVTIVFDQAIIVAIVGLIVNGASVLILDHGKHGHSHSSQHADHHHDHNLRAAYLHVMADALTSILAIFALLLGKYVGLYWMDPLMGIVGAILVTRWSIGLINTTNAVLLDRQSSDFIASQVTHGIEGDTDNRLADLHIWSIGTNIYAAIVSVVTHHPRPPGYYRNLIPVNLGLEHISVEVHQCHED